MIEEAVPACSSIGLPNFRDVGGLSAADGRRVRRGVLFRSSDLNAATAAEFEHLARLELGVVVDLRSSYERNLIGVADLGDVAARVCSVPMLDGALIESVGRPGFSLARTYERIALGSHLEVGRAVAALAEPNALPAVVFCSAGKDRTGVVLAVLLAAMGVCRQDILDDYAASAGSTRKVVDRLMARVPAADRPELSEEVFAAPPRALARALDRIEDDFGDVRSYLLAGGVSAEDLARLERGVMDETANGLPA